MNAISLRTRVELCICATDSSRWITRDLFRNWMCRLNSERQREHEAFPLRADRELENCGGANALEHDAFHSYRTRRHYWHRGRDVDGHGYWRNSSRIRQKYGHLRR